MVSIVVHILLYQDVTRINCLIRIVTKRPQCLSLQHGLIDGRRVTGWHDDMQQKEFADYGFPSS